MVTDPIPPVSHRLAPWPRAVPVTLRVAIFVEAMLELMWLDFCALFGLRAQCAAVSRVRQSPTPCSYDALALTRVAIRDAAVFYVKRVHCLQRSAAVTRMLRRRGLAAELVVGSQAMPVRLHAWVEVAGVVVLEQISGLSHYQVICRA